MLLVRISVLSIIGLSFVCCLLRHRKFSLGLLYQRLSRRPVELHDIRQPALGCLVWAHPGKLLIVYCYSVKLDDYNRPSKTVSVLVLG